jgi:outer membrane lipoprotein SlyB
MQDYFERETNMNSTLNSNNNAGNSGGNSAPASSPSAHRTSPIVIGAAVSVMLFSMLGIAALTGVLPDARSQKSAEEAIAHKQVAANRSVQASRAPAKIASVGGCVTCGTVDAVRAVEVKGDATGLGVVAGGLTGAVVGNQMGRGNGNTAMTILGAAGGAYAGNEIEKNVKKQVSYRVTVRMDDGSFRTVSQAAPAAVGEKVRIVDGAIVARS